MPYLRPGSEPPKKGKGSKLSAKMMLFVDEYLVDLNGSEAVLRAGYKTRNKNRMASELLRHPLVKAEIEKRTEKRRESMELRADYLLNKLINIIESAEDKTSDKLKAIELAGKSIALWKERQEISGPDGEAIKTEQKVKEDVESFTSSLARLAKRNGTSEITEFPKRGSEG